MSAIHDGFERISAKATVVDTPASTAANTDAATPRGPTNHSKQGLAIATGTAMVPVASLAVARRQQIQKANPNDGYAQHFEKRPQRMHKDLIMCVDATSVRKHQVEDLSMVQISKVFAGAGEVFMGFGKPNVYTAFPDGEGGYQKFSAKSFRTGPAKTVDTRNFVQSGSMFRLVNPPPGCVEALAESFKALEGQKGRTCLNMNLRGWANAGFTLGDLELTSFYRPATFQAAFAHEGVAKQQLKWRGISVQVEVDNTNPDTLEEHGIEVTIAEALTFHRHFHRHVDPYLEKIGVFKVTGAIKAALGMNEPAAAIARPTVAPALVANNEMSDYVVQMSMPNSFGEKARLLVGARPLIEVHQDRVRLADYIPRKDDGMDALAPFRDANAKPDRWLKKNVIMSKPVTNGLRAIGAKSMSRISMNGECDIHRMMRTDSPGHPNRYTLVVRHDDSVMPSGSSFTVAPIKHEKGLVKRLLNYLMTKHIYAADWQNAAYACEIRKLEDGTIEVNRDSGTYQPGSKEAEKFAEFIQAVFPNAKFRFV